MSKGNGQVSLFYLPRYLDEGVCVCVCVCTHVHVHEGGVGSRGWLEK